MEYCCHIWASPPSCNLDMLGKQQKQLCKVVDPTLAVFIEPLAHSQNVASSSFAYRSEAAVQRCS